MIRILLAVLMLFVAAGCGLARRSDDGRTATYLTESAWVRNGEPIVFEGEDWFPTDEVESLLDGEMYQAGMFRETPFFIERTDVRPFDRVYTRFAQNRYRAFEQ